MTLNDPSLTFDPIKKVEILKLIHMHEFVMVMLCYKDEL